MRLVKHLPGDLALIRDDTADVVDRVDAFGRLASDKVRSIRPVAEQWLADEDPFLRGEAIDFLLTYWGEDVDVDAGIRMLAEDRDVLVRSAAAGALGGYLDLSGDHKDRILAALVRQLEVDPDPIVHRICYEGLLRALYTASEPPWFKGSHHFDRDRDVDWDLLAPWRAARSAEAAPGRAPGDDEPAPG